MASSPISEVNTHVFEKFSPVTGEKLGEWPISTKDDVDAAVARARKAFPAWRDTPLSERLKFIKRVGDIVAEDVEYFSTRISEDTGKPPVDAIMTELLVMPLFIEYFEKTAPRLLSRKRVRNPLLLPLKKSYIEHFPMGVIGIISPWNFPFQLSVVPIMSALVAGNTVVLKPSEVTPITGEIIEELFERVGLPDGVFQVIQGDGSTGAALTESNIDKIFFTGSVATGRKVMAAAAKRPIPVELELGGKDAFIVCHDAPLERTAKAAVWGGLLNCSCCNLGRADLGCGRGL
ncbi:MAG: aldehyde dehydrogenase family protein [bacterium]